MREDLRVSTFDFLKTLPERTEGLSALVGGMSVKICTTVLIINFIRTTNQPLEMRTVMQLTAVENVQDMLKKKFTDLRTE